MNAARVPSGETARSWSPGNNHGTSYRRFPSGETAVGTSLVTPMITWFVVWAEAVAATAAAAKVAVATWTILGTEVP
ncbi:MAG: hypothetical protein R2878_04860 [Thermoleophilia bacterium]